MSKGIIVSGMRPTGKLHLGHLYVLENWVRLQKEYDCHYFVADWHALSTSFEDNSSMRDNTREMVTDWLAAGMDPEKSVIFVQSDIMEHAELHLIFSMITPLSWLERVPTFKDQVQQLKEQGKDINTYGFLGYPLLQAADILLYKADAVPVGEDQLPHLELCREVARRFNYLYRPVFPEPQGLVARVPLLPGIDGRKMSKSYHNDIVIGAEPDVLKERVNAMITDPARIRKTDPGHPEVCIVHEYHNIYASDKLAGLEEECRGGKIGCVACKKMLAASIEEVMAPVRERRADILKRPGYIDDILAEGARKAKAKSAETMKEVREVVSGIKNNSHN
ncbi:tryptophan--tRNA ligase [Pelotomaculum terephthalicicum JT]|uniref:tryptophan--tRNA ligase n=1 Tax=Pelotomaculum TaxID=191373 RepID=UPI0009D0A443|nr:MULTISPECIES: tryptophan--tRNA ligase [Pelotomaculum]MCG9968850.1 tryptophan--tRNA ligase [Pelotomaculum terephthalicicum JT]OPX85089.1 MAG: Tryptophan--tRNA ligase [Pelotomaculum sp. PtaB.Bin117]OPY59492.1 MAG: Tryptophan--tRNA ligase [Pelotomaculum sp. PtaU1.Bin035]